jgi:RNA polymerase sigma-70 factor (ECF subfamily)
MSRLSDIALIAQVVATGSHRAFGQLVEAHQEPVRRFLRRLTGGDEMLADDLAQETFIRAWEGIGSFRQLSGFETWLLRIAYRVFLDEKRKVVALPAEQVREPSEPSESSGERWSLHHDLDRALATLSETERTCVVLQVVEGQSIREISQITGIPENTVKSHLLRGKKNLASYLRKNGY